MCSTAPIDISKNKIVGNCDQKCAFFPEYSSANIKLTNRGDYISATAIENSTATLNNAKYNVTELRLYHPSLHTFNTKQTDAELVIVNTAVMGQPSLLVCVPIKVGSSTSPIVSQMVSNQILRTSDATNIALDSLGDAVPSKPFFTYSGSLPYAPCGANATYIVYGLNDALTIDANTLSLLQKLTNSHKYTTKNGPEHSGSQATPRSSSVSDANASSTPELFYNPNGTSATSQNEFYVNCEGMTDENVAKKSSPPQWGLTPQSMSAIQILVGSVLIVFILFLVSRISVAFGDVNQKSMLKNFTTLNR